MASSVITGLISEPGIRVVVADVAEVAQKARESHELFPGAALLLAQGLTAGALLAALSKENQPINLQLECDGPLRGLFVDAQPDGSLRGYVKNRYVEFEGEAGEYRYRPILGNRGFLSVLRDLGNGEFYRSAVELSHFDVAADLEAFFAQSEQALTRVGLWVQADGENPICRVWGLLLQALPGADAGAFESVAQRLMKKGPFHHAGQISGPASELVDSWLKAEGFSRMKEVPLAYRCRCSFEKVMGALRMLGAAELTDILLKEGKAEATCHFCGRKYIANGEDLQSMLSLMQSTGKN